MQLRYAIHRAAWVMLYLFFILAPLFALLVGPFPPTRDFWTEFSVALGYSGLAMMGLQFGLTARFRYVTEPWGEDVIYHFHRRISLIAVGLVITHPVILVAVKPELLAPSNMLEAPLSAHLALLSIFSVIALVVTALWRAALNLKYETWHLTHIVLAVVAIGAGVVHMVGSSFYLVDPWKQSLWIGLTIFWVGLLLYVRIVEPLFMPFGKAYHGKDEFLARWVRSVRGTSVAGRRGRRRWRPVRGHRPRPWRHARWGRRETGR